MSREAVNQIIDRAVADESFFELLRNQPDKAVEGYALETAELSAIRAGAYNVVVRATRQERQEESDLAASRAAKTSAAAYAAAQPAPMPASAQPKMPVGGLIGFFVAVLVIGGGVGGFRYVQHQWPWQALGFAKAAAQPSIPAPTLGARPKPSGQAAASGAPAASAKPAPSAAGAAAAPTSAAPKPAASGQAQLRPTPQASGSPVASASSAAGQADASRAYYQAVGSRMASLMKSFSSVLASLRAGNDPSKDLADVSTELGDLKQHLDDAPPPDQLKQQHQTLVQAIPLLQADSDQLKTAVGQKNSVQAVLIASEMDAMLNQVPDEMAFATQPHPEIYQPVNSSQQLTHILNFDVLSQNVAARSNTPASVVLRIGVQSANPSKDEVSDTVRHGIVAARETYPQAGQVRIVAFAESNGSAGNQQIGSADWYCSPDARPPDYNASANWQDSCARVYVTLPGSSPSVVPY
jgi:hypothetical protein